MHVIVLYLLRFLQSLWGFSWPFDLFIEYGGKKHIRRDHALSDRWKGCGLTTAP